MNTATNALVVAPAISSHKDINALVLYGTEEEILEKKMEVESKLSTLTSGETRMFGHIVEALRAHLAILNTTLSLI